jgi:hypothetical protein
MDQRVVVAKGDFGVVALVLSFRGEISRYDHNWLNMTMAAVTQCFFVEGIAWSLLRRSSCENS